MRAARKISKWAASALRVVAAKIRLGGGLSLGRGGKPIYLGRGVRLEVGSGGAMTIGSGAYIDDYCRLQAGDGASLVIGEGVYMNTNCRVVAADAVTIGARTMLGPNVCVYDHDHLFDVDGVRGDLASAPVEVGTRCWIAANSLVTRGVKVSDRILVGGGSVVTRSLLEPGVYAGAPARLVRSLAPGLGAADEEGDEGGPAPQGQERAVPAPYQGPPREGA